MHDPAVGNGDHLGAALSGCVDHPDVFEDPARLGQGGPQPGGVAACDLVALGLGQGQGVERGEVSGGIEQGPVRSEQHPVGSQGAPRRDEGGAGLGGRVGQAADLDPEVVGGAREGSEGGPELVGGDHGGVGVGADDVEQSGRVGGGLHRRVDQDRQRGGSGGIEDGPEGRCGGWVVEVQPLADQVQLEPARALGAATLHFGRRPGRGDGDAAERQQRAVIAGLVEGPVVRALREPALVVGRVVPRRQHAGAIDLGFGEGGEGGVRRGGGVGLLGAQVDVAVGGRRPGEGREGSEGEGEGRDHGSRKASSWQCRTSRSKAACGGVGVAIQPHAGVEVRGSRGGALGGERFRPLGSGQVWFVDRSEGCGSSGAEVNCGPYFCRIRRYVGCHFLHSIGDIWIVRRAQVYSC